MSGYREYPAESVRRIRFIKRAAVAGLLGVTALSLARQGFSHWSYLVVAAMALVVSLGTKIHPLLILVVGSVLGVLIGK